MSVEAWPRISQAIPRYVASLGVVTAGFALVQAANNTAVMADSATDQRGHVSGLLNPSLNLGLITGASVMGAVIAAGASSSNLIVASPQALAPGMRTRFVVATVLVAIAIAIALVIALATALPAWARTRPR
jgi:hypothetical protein